MTRVSTMIAPANSILFISGRSRPRPPSPWRDEMVFGDASCVLICCFPEQDGETEVILGRVSEVDPKFEPAFVGTLDTGSREVVISGVERERIIDAKVPNKQTKIRIWLSHPKWPERVTIGIE